MTEYAWAYWVLWGGIALVVMLVASAMGRRKRSRRFLHESSAYSTADIDVLNEQLIQGEISRQEYEARLAEIRSRRRVA